MTFDKSGWRQGAACVAALTFDVDAEAPILAAGRRYADNAMAMTHQAFGPKLGVPRILQMLKDVQQPATFFIPGVTAERYPHMVEQVLESGHEVAHHSHTHRTAVNMSFDD
jgi:peptidoglycan/xylan/chitin deacetylase (PgdA/CDA1 family)